MTSTSGATITAVAHAAEVSTATVSRVMSGRSVSSELRRRVLAAATDLDYHPSRVAQGLASGRHQTIGVVVPDLANPYFSQVLKVITGKAAGRGFRTVVADADADNDADAELDLCRTLLRQADALVVVSPRMTAENLHALAADSDNVILVNRMVPGLGLPAVTIDAFGGMFRLCGHLARLGHRRLVYLSGPDAAWQNGERLRAVHHATAFGLEVATVSAGSTLEDGEAAVDAAMAHDPTALVGFNDLVAIGAMLAVQRRGLQVPADLSITGADDIPLARCVNPGLTTTAASLRQLGERTWGHVDALLCGEPGIDTPALLPELVERGSTAPPQIL